MAKSKSSAACIGAAGHCILKEIWGLEANAKCKITQEVMLLRHRGVVVFLPCFRCLAYKKSLPFLA